MDIALPLPTSMQSELAFKTISEAQKKASLKAAREFETVLLSNLLQPMFEGIETDGIFGGGHAEEQWKPMLVDQYARKMADTGGMGLSSHIYKTMLELQENANGI
jgi:peptidoglycan hydrolase FlgJ